MLRNKFWQAFFALAPIIIFFIAIIGYFIFIFSIIGDIQDYEDSEGPPIALLKGVGTFFMFIMLAIFVSLGSLVFYIVHAVKNPNLKENNLLLVWILLFVFVGGIGQLIYWIIEILNKRENVPIN